MQTNFTHGKGKEKWVSKLLTAVAKSLMLYEVRSLKGKGLHLKCLLIKIRNFEFSDILEGKIELFHSFGSNLLYVNTLPLRNGLLN